MPLPNGRSPHVVGSPFWVGQSRTERASEWGWGTGSRPGVPVGVWSLLGEWKPEPHPAGLPGPCLWGVHTELSREPGSVRRSPPLSKNRVVLFCSRKRCLRGGSGRRADEKEGGWGKG